MNVLDEKGFVFTGSDNKPYLCRMHGGFPWFFYWNDDGWVTLKEANTMQIVQAYKKKLTEIESEKFHTLSNREDD